MIQVQIASTLHAEGVSGVRWVLVDPSDARVDAPGAPMASPAVQPAPVSAGTVRRTPLTLRVITAVVLVTALAGAWWVASLVMDPAAVVQTTADGPR